MTGRALLPRSHAARHPAKAAIIHAASGEIITYAELDAQANRVSHLLRVRGIEAGGHIALALPNDSTLLALVWGCIYAGVYYTPLSTRLTAEEATYIVNDCGATAFVTSAAVIDEQYLKHLASNCPDVSAWLSVGHLPGSDDYAEAVAAQPASALECDVEGEDVLYSSGTTGRPKGVRRPATRRPIGTPDATYMLSSKLFGIHPEAVYLSPAPLYHAAPLRFALAVLRAGGTVVAMDRFDAATALALIEKHRVTTSQWVPTMFVRILKLPADVRAHHDISSLEYAVHAAAPCPRTVKRQMIDWWGPILHEYYGGTEGNGITYCNSEEWLAHEGTVGRPILGELHIVDDDGDEQPANVDGIVYFGGGPPFEYHNDPDATSASRDPKGRGWTTLGDIGHVDDDGYLYLTDRRSHMIITGGVNVYPQEVENLLIAHPAVLDVAVIGVPHDEFGEAVKAVVQPADGVSTGPRLADDLIAYCRDHLADVKCPKSVDFREQLPRHPTGKLYKRLLRDEYWADHSSRLVAD
jgi:acyl-CoA synthetase (AMP-forming)/AMP-acid ligase II